MKPCETARWTARRIFPEWQFYPRRFPGFREVTGTQAFSAAALLALVAGARTVEAGHADPEQDEGEGPGEKGREKKADTS